jgi:hypothetical protein
VTKELTKGIKIMKTLIIEIKSIYGQDKIYPVCTQAKGFCKLLGQKTLTEDNLRVIKNELGYSLELKAKSLAI